MQFDRAACRTFMTQSFPSCLRVERKRSGLTQDELGNLLGFQASSAVSRLERGEREPDLRTAFACQIVFDRSPHELFPGAHAEARRMVGERAAKMVDRFSRADRDNRTAHKLQRLRGLTLDDLSA